MITHSLTESIGAEVATTALAGYAALSELLFAIPSTLLSPLVERLRNLYQDKGLMKSPCLNAAKPKVLCWLALDGTIAC